jgi:Uma2 family endonuclease
MAVSALVSVEEYLHTTYHPDCDYLDGELLERNLGERDHGRLQSRIIMWLGARERALGIVSMVEVRLRINRERFRIPDVMVVSADAPNEAVVVTPPLLCIEVLSPSDSLNRIWDRTQDYLSIGVPICWILDPAAHRAWTVTSAGMVEAQDGILRAGEIAMPLADVLEPVSL